jgi:chemotaxis response regulator CheB
MRKDPIRVLVVDDSALMRKLIPQMLAADAGPGNARHERN